MPGVSGSALDERGTPLLVEWQMVSVGAPALGEPCPSLELGAFVGVAKWVGQLTGTLCVTRLCGHQLVLNPRPYVVLGWGRNKDNGSKTHRAEQSIQKRSAPECLPIREIVRPTLNGSISGDEHKLRGTHLAEQGALLMCASGLGGIQKGGRSVGPTNKGVAYHVQRPPRTQSLTLMQG